MAIASLGTRTGSVASFDDFRGLGIIAGDDGRSYAFHCTGIGDGTRTVAPGTLVRFDVIAGRLGRWEAWAISPR